MQTIAYDGPQYGHSIVSFSVAMFMLAIVPSAFMGSPLSSWLLMAMALARYGKAMLPGILSLLATGCPEHLPRSKSALALSLLRPLGILLDNPCFMILMTFNGCTKQEVGHTL